MSKQITKAKQQVNEMRTDLDLAAQTKYEKLAIFADGQPFSKKRYVDAAKLAMQQHVLNAIEAGKRLIVLKEMLDHGEFIAALKEIGVETRTASNYMRVAFRFSGFDQELANELGITKLYKLLSAPVSEVERLKDDGQFLDMNENELIAISARELENRIREATEKAKFDLQSERDAKNVLFEEKRQLQKQLEKLDDELLQARTGAKPADPLPEWWGEFNNVLGALESFSMALAENQPDLADEKLAKRCLVVQQRIDGELAHCLKYLSDSPVDPVEFRRAQKEKLAALSSDERFDFENLDADS